MPIVGYFFEEPFFNFLVGQNGLKQKFMNISLFCELQRQLGYFNEFFSFALKKIKNRIQFTENCFLNFQQKINNSQPFSRKDIVGISARVNYYSLLLKYFNIPFL
jgi:hypothetical protein